MKTVTIPLEDWKAIKRLVRDDLAVYQSSYGLPGRLRATWRGELRKTSPQSLEIIEAAEKAITRGRSAGKR